MVTILDSPRCLVQCKPACTQPKFKTVRLLLRMFRSNHSNLGPHSHCNHWRRTSRVDQAVDVDSMLALMLVLMLQNGTTRDDFTIAASNIFNLDLRRSSSFAHTNNRRKSIISCIRCIANKSFFIHTYSPSC